MRIFDCQQNTPEWLEARRGIPTASNFDLIITTRGEVSRQRQKYMFKLVAESLSGINEDGFTSTAMERGKLLEEEARSFYQMLTNQKIDQVGFILDEEGFGCSPDGLIGDDGLLEIKCPISTTHISYLVNNELPGEYIQQVQGQLLVTGRQWVDFVSYYPAIKPLIIRVHRNEKLISLLKKELIQFNLEKNILIKTLKEN